MTEPWRTVTTHGRIALWPFLLCWVGWADGWRIAELFCRGKWLHKWRWYKAG